MANQMRKAIVGFLLTLSVPAVASTDVWKSFHISNHFSVMYPGTWFPIGASADRLQLLSSKGGAEGVIIKRGQALITVMEPEGYSTKSLAQVIDYYTQGSSILLTKGIFDKSSKQACTDLEESNFKKNRPIPPEDALISVPSFVDTDFFCEVDGRKDRNWT